MKTTKTIAGRKITLQRGRLYWAGRPFARRGRTTYPVTIYDITRGFHFDNAVATVAGLTYDAANALLEAFNNGASSFDGRVW